MPRVPDLDDDFRAGRALRRDAERLEALEREVRVMGERVDELTTTVGRAPNAATGDPGSGMAGVLAELARDRGRLSRWSAVGAAGGAGFVWGVYEIGRILFAHWGLG